MGERETSLWSRVFDSRSLDGRSSSFDVPQVGRTAFRIVRVASARRCCSFEGSKDRVNGREEVRFEDGGIRVPD